MTVSGNRSTSKYIEVSTLTLANAVELHGLYFSLLSGGFNHYSVLNLNDDIIMIGMLVLEAGGVQAGEYGFTIQAVTAEGDIAGSIRPVYKIVKPGDILRINTWFRFNVRVTNYGMWAIIVRHEERILTRLPIAIQQGIPGKTEMLPEE